MVHSTEWTTGSQLFRAFDPVSASSPGASGPLARVDHWLAAFRAFGLVAALFRGASGPLSKVDHWLAPFPSFRPSFAPPHATQKPGLGPGCHNS